MAAMIDPDRRNRHPRMLTDTERARLEEFGDAIHYSSRYVFSTTVIRGSSLQVLTL